MTIAKGVEWGEPGPLPLDAPVAAGDAELAELVRSDVLAGSTPGPVGVTGGDLFATLGGTRASRRPTDPEAWRVPMDAMVVRWGGTGAVSAPVVAVAHVVAFRCAPGVGFRTRLASLARRRTRAADLLGMPWFVDETLVVANAAFVGDWNVAPRGHPNDGRADVTRGRLPRRDRRRIGTRLRTGTHLPHPDLVTSRPKALDSGVGPWRLFLDGADHGVAEQFSVQVVPDAFTVVR